MSHRLVTVAIVPTTEESPEPAERKAAVAAGPDATEAALPRTIWLLSENRRVTITLVVALVVAIATQQVLRRAYEPYRELAAVDPIGAALLPPVMVWAVFALVHVLLTWLAYRGLRGEEFRVAVTADPSWISYDRRRHRAVFRFFVGVGPSSWATSVAVFALIAVVALVMRPALRELTLSFAVALMMVATAWLSVAVTYGVHYARVHLTRGGLGYPGDEPDGMLDYFYLAAGVQATFGTTDVEVRSRELRAQVLSQSLLAFVFNTVIVGMVISLLLTAG